MTKDQAFGSSHYVPILKAKMGERLAVRDLTNEQKSALTPLFELPLDAQGTSDQIANAWGTEERFFCHILNLELEDPDSWAERIAEQFEMLHESGLSFVPVIAIDDPTEVFRVVAECVSQDHQGVCVRVDAESYATEQPDVFRRLLENALDWLSIEPSLTDLIIDAGTVRESPIAMFLSARSILNMVSDIGAYRTLTTAFSAFPESLTGFEKDVVTMVERDDAIVWNNLISSGQLERLPTFSDYGIGTPIYKDAPFLPIPAIRYTTNDRRWAIHRGHSRQNPGPQYEALAAEIVQEAYFTGSNFSGGDQYIFDVANGSDGPGNPMSWVRAGLNHHLAVVVNEFASGNGA